MFRLVIKTDNEAFKDDARGEIARILEEVVAKIHRGEEPSKLQDINGNTVGGIIWGI